MTKRIASVFWIVLATSLFSACGGDGRSTSVSAAGSSTITYRLTPEPNPQIVKNGSFIGVKFPPHGTTGLSVDVGLLGTIDVISEIPTGDLALDYRITRVEMTTLNPMIVNEISAEGADLGRIQLHTDGTLSMDLQVPILGITYDLSTSNSIYHPPDAIPPRYRFEDGKLYLRGVSLRTPVEEPYWGTPLIYVWADPES
jgi:hypothetical protein